MKSSPLFFLIFTGVTFMTIRCNNEKPKSSSPHPQAESKIITRISPDFNADSAYYFVQKQVEFGPRVNNTEAHVRCGDWMVSELKKHGMQVTEQKTTITTFEGKKLNVRNVIGSINLKASKRILLCAHWDSRPVADKDDRDRDKPIDGADDGASGVGVLLEVARVLKYNPVEIGVDIVFFDAEDLGNHRPNSWCLGSQYWSNNPHIPNYKADFGILLDMVGGANATFAWEENSVAFAKPVQEKVWTTAHNIGYGKHFIYYQSGAIDDDHVYVNRNLGIPTIDIIHYNPTTPSTFPEYHHTHRDNMSVIDRNTLRAVGQTVLEVLYTEKQ